MEFTVYILFSDTFNKHYVGYTSNLEARFLSHNELGTNGFTVKYRPWKIIYVEVFSTKEAALQKEKYLKTGAGRDFIKTLKH